MAFDADDGAPPDTASKSVTFGAAYGTLATTTRTGYTFAGWWTDPGGTGTEVTAVTLMAAADPHTLYAKWVVNPTLTVNSLHGVTTPGLGSEPYDWGTALDCSVVSPVTLGTTQYVCTGWTGTGSVPSSGAGTNVSFTITEDSSIVWHWTTNYWLEATAVAGEGQVTGGDIWVAAGSEATLTASAEVGYRFDHWLLDGQPAGGTTNELVVLMDAMHAVEAGFVVLDLAEALDTPGRVWTTGGTTNWFPQTAVSHDGIDAARSGLISHRQTSWLETVVTNAGTLRFRWKVSSEAGFDWYSNRVDGVHQARISGETDWEQVSLRIEGLGPHTVRWEYSKDKSFSVGDDCGYLDEVVWLADAWLDTEVAGHGSVDVEDGWYHHGSNAVIRATPEAHHHFVGWSGDLDGCTTNGVELTAPMVQSRLVTAHFAADTYVATFDAQGGETPVPAGKTVAYNEAYGVLATVARTDYAWAGWWTAPDGGAEVTAETTVTATDDHVLHARWIPNGYTATFDGSGGAVSSETLEVVYDAAYGTLPTATRSGYAFGGWWTGNNGTGVAIGADSVVTTAADHTLHAQWTAKTYTVTYDAGGGTVEPSGKTVVFDAAYGELASPVRAGYRFDGWWTEGGGAGQEITALSPVSTADHHTLYAQWTANSYLVTFDAEDGTVAPAGQTVVFGAAYGALPVPNREGHAFGGWWDGDGGTGSQVDAATLVATAQDHSLHAKWLINAHSLTVNSDHGTPLPFVGTQLLDWGTNLACSVTSPDTQGATRYVCSGWSGSGSVPSAGTMTNTDVFALTNDSSITWSWSKEYLLDIEVSGHGEVDRTDTWCADGSNITVRATAASGNRFNHWTLDGVQTGGYTNAIDLLMDASRQLTAHFVVFDLPEAVDSVDLVWTNGEDAVWTPQISVTHDGIDAARSGLIPDYGSTWIQTTVSGKGTVSFWWKTSSEENCDFIHFHVNGAINQSRSGETDWAFVSLHFDSDEEHVLRWEYTKDKSDTAGEDCGWVDQVVWTPDAPPLTGFALWAHGRGIDGGDAAALFGQLNPVSGVPYGVEYACGTNLTTGAPLLNIRMVNGRPVVEVATQDPATLAHVAVRVVGTADLASGVWSLPIRPASNTDGKPANRDWYELSGVSPGRAFFKLVAGLRSADAPGSFAFWLAERDLSGDHAELFGQLSPERGVPYGLLYAFGDNLTPGAPLLNIRVVNGRPVVETPVQDAATLPYVDLRVVGSTNLADWTLPVAPAADTAGKPANRAWHAPAGTPPERAFFKIEAGLK